MCVESALGSRFLERQLWKETKMGYPCLPFGFDIVWPEKVFLPADKLKLWYIDAAANGKCQPGLRRFYDKALALHDAGLITLKSNPTLENYRKERENR